MIDRITELMKRNNMTAKELTERLGVNRSTVSEWKSGKTKPSVDHVRKLAALFEVSTDYIINGDTEHMDTAYKTPDRELDITMLNVYSRLSSKHRDAVRDFFYMCMQELEKNETEVGLGTKSAFSQEYQNHIDIDTNDKSGEASGSMTGELSIEAAYRDEDEDFPDFDTFEAALSCRKRS